MAAVTSGVQLVVMLRDSGTGEAKLAVAREALKLAADEDRHPTAEEVIEYMEQSGTVPDGTLEKARSIAEHGRWDVPTVKREVPIEDRFPVAPQEQAQEQQAQPIKQPSKPSPVKPS